MSLRSVRRFLYSLISFISAVFQREVEIETSSSGSQTTNTIALISHASKVMLKILQVRLQQYMNPELPDVQAGFRKDR